MDRNARSIISRTQRFDFKRIGVQDIVEHLKHILAEINVPFEEQAIYVIARAAEGGMRDALSILDQAISFSEGTITLENAMQVTGSLTHEMMDRYLEHCLQHNVEEALEALEQILAEGKEARRFLEDMLLYCRDLLMYQQAPKLLEEKSGQLTEQFKALAETISAELLYEYIRLLNETQNEVRFTNHANIYLEVVTVKIATIAKPIALSQPEAVGDAQEMQTLQNQVNQLKQELEQLKANGIATKASEPAKTERPKVAKTGVRVPKEQVFQVLKEATKENLTNVRNVWEDLLQTLTVTQRAMLKASEPVAAGPQRLLIAFDYEIVCQRAMNDMEFGQAIQSSLQRLTENYGPEVMYIPRDSWPEIRQAYVEYAKQQPQEVADFEDDEEITLLPQEDNKVVEEAQKLFGDMVTVLDD